VSFPFAMLLLLLIPLWIALPTQFGSRRDSGHAEREILCDAAVKVPLLLLLLLHL
jgi:hypothetical protein